METYKDSRENVWRGCMTQRLTPPLPLSYTFKEPISYVFTFLESLGQYNLCGQPFVLNFEIKDPFLGKKAKPKPRFLSFKRSIYYVCIHVRTQYSVDPGQPPPSIVYF